MARFLLSPGMIKKLARLFTIKTRLEAFAVIYAIAVGAVGRGVHYLQIYPGWQGYFMFAACTAAVFVAGAKILDATDRKRKQGEERRAADRRAPA
jgi:membrane protein implicated in regulation of membrane protease activity